MSHVFGRSCAKQLPIVASGEGVFLTDTDGKRYLDACGGAAVSCLGHGNRALVDAVKHQVEQIAYAHTSFFTSEPAETLAARLVALAPGDIDKVYFVSGGSEAVEAAIKLARQYHVENGDDKRTEIIARTQSYHGNTIGALSAGGNLWRRRQFEPLLSHSMHHIDPCYYWRWAEPGETPEAYGQRVAAQLEDKINELGAERVAAFIAEPVVGATLGAVAAEPGYFKSIRDICDRYGVLLILDEVMCGMGRTGYFFASEAEDIEPDIVCIAKGLGAGVQPLGATLCSRTIFDAVAGGTGFFQHGHTYLAHPTACAAGVAVLETLTAESDDGGNLVSGVRDRGELFLGLLAEALADHPHIGDIRGRGFFAGVEFVQDADTRQPLDPAMRFHAKLKQQAFEEGLMIYAMGGTVDGQSGDHTLLAPPFIATNDDLATIANLLRESVDALLPAA